MSDIWSDAATAFATIEHGIQKADQGHYDVVGAAINRGRRFAADRDALVARVAELETMLNEARTDIVSYVSQEYPDANCMVYPDIARRRHRDLELVRRIDAALPIPPVPKGDAP